MTRLRVVVAYIVTYGFYVVMWLAFVSFLLLGGSALAIGGPLDELPLRQVIWNAGVLATGTGLLYLAAVGFVEWSRPRRERLWELWVEAEDAERDDAEAAEETDRPSG